MEIHVQTKVTLQRSRVMEKGSKKIASLEKKFSSSEARNPQSSEVL